MTLLLAPALKGKVQDTAIQRKISLSRAIQHLRHPYVHDALVILKNSLAMPKLLYLIRTSECGDNPLLDQFDTILRKGLTETLNVHFNDDQWLQASLAVVMGASVFWHQLLPHSCSSSPFFRMVRGPLSALSLYGQTWPTHPNLLQKCTTSRRPGTGWWQQINDPSFCPKPPARPTKPDFSRCQLPMLATGFTHHQ